MTPRLIGSKVLMSHPKDGALDRTESPSPSRGIGTQCLRPGALGPNASVPGHWDGIRVPLVRDERNRYERFSLRQRLVQCDPNVIL